MVDPTAVARFPILVVDDEPLLREIIAETLSEYQVTVATDGRTAIDLMRAGGFEMVITDLMMPQTDGFAILNAAQTITPSPSVLVITGYPSDAHMQRCHELGCLDVMSKPFSVLAVRDTVERCARERGLRA